MGVNACTEGESPQEAYAPGRDRSLRHLKQPWRKIRLYNSRTQMCRLQECIHSFKYLSSTYYLQSVTQKITKKEADIIPVLEKDKTDTNK